MMKRILLTVCISIGTLGFADDQPNIPHETPPPQLNQAQPAPAPLNQINWYTNYAQAVQEAQKARKPILLFFTGSDWCGWCKKMHQEIFASPDFISQVGNGFVFVDVDFPMNTKLPAELAQQNTQLKQKYGVTGYPTVIILDSNENFIAETGYRPGGGKAYADYLRQLLQ
jgi:protein disulfide-isomerase